MHIKNKQNRSPFTARFTSLAAAALIVSGCNQNTSKSNNSPAAPITASSATNAVQKRIATIVQEQLGWKQEVTPNLRIVEDLKGDSLDAVELVMAVEKENKRGQSEKVSVRKLLHFYFAHPDPGPQRDHACDQVTKAKEFVGI